MQADVACCHSSFFVLYSVVISPYYSSCLDITSQGEHTVCSGLIATFNHLFARYLFLPFLLL
jgi:hypothetical protein